MATFARYNLWVMRIVPVVFLALACACQSADAHKAAPAASQPKRAPFLRALDSAIESGGDISMPKTVYACFHGQVDADLEKELAAAAKIQEVPLAEPRFRQLFSPADHRSSACAKIDDHAILLAPLYRLVEPARTWVIGRVPKGAYAPRRMANKTIYLTTEAPRG